MAQIEYNYEHDMDHEFKIFTKEECESAMKEIVTIQGQCNFLANNMMNKAFHVTKKKRLLIHIAELLFNMKDKEPLKRHIRVIMLYGKLFEVVNPKRRCKYMQGSLFSIGGLLKI